MLKKGILAVIFTAAIGFCSFAQETGAVRDHSFSFGYGAEVNMYSRDAIAGGAMLNAAYDLPRLFAVGIIAAASGDDLGDATVEGSAFVRRYFFSETHTGLFVQAEMGIAFIITHEDYKYPRLLAGLRGGYRLPFGRIFYVEAYARGGYPLALGGGIVVGYRK